MIGVGQQLGGYTILRRIGRGGLGEVFLAQHRRVARRAAVKVLLPELSQKAAVIDLFFKEARNTSLIKHPGIVEILDCDLLDGQAFIIMEFLDGESLGGYLGRVGPLRQDLAFLLGVAAASAATLDTAHIAGIMHRDLKPENIYLHLAIPTEPGVTVKVLDFGIAKLSREDGGPSQTASGIVLTSPTYMSPEQCRGVGRPDARSDIYSLGCVLYEALCGSPPFQARGIADLVAAHVSMPPKPPIKIVPDLSPKLNSLILRMLAKKPEERPQSMGQVLGTLRDCARAMGIDVEGQLQALNPVQRPTNLFGSPAVPEAAPRPAPVVMQRPPGELADPGKLAGKPVQPPMEPRLVAMATDHRPRPLRGILPPAPEAFSTHAVSPLPPIGRAVPRVVAGNAPPGTEAAPSDKSQPPALGRSVQALAGGTMILDSPVAPELRRVPARPVRESPIPNPVGGTMVMDSARETMTESSYQEPADDADGQQWTAGGQSLGAIWSRQVLPAMKKRSRLLALVGGVSVLATVVFVAILPNDSDRARARQSALARRSNRPRPTDMDPVPAAPASPAVLTPVVPPSARPLEMAKPTDLATVQVDIQGLAPHTVVTLDNQLVTLPIRIPRGPDIHRIGLRSPTGGERTIEIDGTRDRAIELLVERQAAPPRPIAPRHDGPGPAAQKDVGHKAPASLHGGDGTTARKPPSSKNELKTITDI